MPISQAEVEVLLESGEWVSDVDLDAELDARVPLGPASVAARQLLRSQVAAVLSDRVDTRAVGPNSRFPPKVMGFRLAPYKVYKVGPTLKQVAFRALGMAGRILSHSPLATAAAAYYLIKTAFGGYEKLTDPDERAVFEAVWLLQDEPVHSKLGVPPRTADPTVAGITHYLQGSVDEEHVAAALQRLLARGIVSEAFGRWSVRL